MCYYSASILGCTRTVADVVYKHFLQATVERSREIRVLTLKYILFGDLYFRISLV